MERIHTEGQGEIDCMAEAVRIEQKGMIQTAAAIGHLAPNKTRTTTEECPSCLALYQP
jgi:hypothetical protein